MSGQRRRRWSDIKPALVQSIVFAGISVIYQTMLNRYIGSVHTIQITVSLPFNPYNAEILLYKPWRSKGFSI